MIRIGVLGTANIAERRMIPAILKSKSFEYAGVAIATKEEVGTNCTDQEFELALNAKINRAELFVRQFGSEYIIGYEEMLKRDDIDAVYIPLPPALHYKWAKLAISYGKHVLMEKPFTCDLTDTQSLIESAREKNLALAENYGFIYHAQMKRIQKAVAKKEIGELRLIRAAFGFPHRDANDFRYSLKAGGGALLDCGGYTLKAASLLLGDDIKVMSSELSATPGHEVDIYGAATLESSSGKTAQVSWGMDNSYRCELEIWGSKGFISAPRIYTAPDGFEAPVIIQIGNETSEFKYSDDQFLLMLGEFNKMIQFANSKSGSFNEISLQASLMDQCMKC